MNSQINSLHINLFKGFKETQVEFNKGLNLLVGGNNSGKSSILQAIYLSFDFLKLTNGISEIDKKRGVKKERLRGINVKNITLPFHDESYISEGLKKRSVREHATTIKIQTSNELSFMETVTFPGGNLLVISSSTDGTGGNENYRQNISKLVKQKDKFPLFIPTFSGVATREEMKVPEVVKYYIATGKSSEVLRNQLVEFSDIQQKELNSYLNASFGVEIISNKHKEIYLSSTYRENEYDNLDISSAGSGFQQILQILVYIVASKSETILIDEPDAHLHYKLQNILYDILLEIVKSGKQIIVSTHSQVFIKRAIQHDNRLILIDKKMSLQKSIDDHNESLKHLYEEGLVDENTITRGGNIKLIAIEDSVSGNGFKIIQEFLFKINVREPEYDIVSNGGSSNSIIGYVAGKKKIENVTIKGLEFRDCDSLPRKYITKIVKSVKEENVSIIYLTPHEAENFLINSKIITRVLKNKNITISETEVKKILDEVVSDPVNKNLLIDSLEGALEGQCKQHYRLLDMEYGGISTLVRKIRNDIRDNKISYPYAQLPGKEFMKLLKNKIHELYNVSISEIEIAKEFTESEIPREIKNAIEFFNKK